MKITLIVFPVAAALSFTPGSARAETGPISEIVIGNVLAPSPNGYSESLRRAAAAYFQVVNAAGGINGHPIRFTSYDAKGDLKRTLDLTRQLVEKEKAELLFQMDPAAEGNTPYVRFMRIPQLFDARPTDKSGRGGIPPLVQGKVLGAAIKEFMPDSAIAVLYREDWFSNDALTGLYAGLGPDNARLKIKNRLEMSKGTSDSNGIAKIAAEKPYVLVILGDLDLQRQVVADLNDGVWFPIGFMTDAALALQGEEMGGFGAIITLENRPRNVTEDQKLAWERFRADHLPDKQENPEAAFVGFLQAQAVVQLLRMCEGNERRKCLDDRYSRSEERRIAQPVIFEQGEWKPVGPQGPPID